MSGVVYDLRRALLVRDINVLEWSYSARQLNIPAGENFSRLERLRRHPFEWSKATFPQISSALISFLGAPPGLHSLRRRDHKIRRVHDIATITVTFPSGSHDDIMETIPVRVSAYAAREWHLAHRLPESATALSMYQASSHSRKLLQPSLERLHRRHQRPLIRTLDALDESHKRRRPSSDKRLTQSVLMFAHCASLSIGQVTARLTLPFRYPTILSTSPSLTSTLPSSPIDKCFGGWPSPLAAVGSLARENVRRPSMI